MVTQQGWGLQYVNELLCELFDIFPLEFREKNLGPMGSTRASEVKQGLRGEAAWLFSPQLPRLTSNLAILLSEPHELLGLQAPTATPSAL